MDHIYQPNEAFDFSSLSLAHPSGIQGGAYFTKMLAHQKPLYIETPASLTRQGFVKHGKKYYCDLQFEQSDRDFLQWLETLETTCQELIFKRSDTWFEGSLNLNDIENAFTSPTRIYKSGKYYLVRVNVRMNYTTGQPVIKIFNEHESPVNIEAVAPEQKMISVLEVQGVKFTSRNFQIELEIKQAMILNTEQLFEQCVIKPQSIRSILGEPKKELHVEEIIEEKKKNQKENDVVEEKVEGEQENQIDREEEEKVEGEQEEDIEREEKEEEQIERQEGVLDEKEKEKEKEKELAVDIDAFSLEEVDQFSLASDSNLETITLKKPNQVYYEIYKVARKKAKEAKQQAIVAFLEAKNIKTTYMLEDLDESDDSDIDSIS